MKPWNHLIVAGVLFVWMGAARAALIVHEPFAYAAGALAGQSGGTGWASAWTGSGNSIVAPGLQYDDGLYQLVASSNACQLGGFSAATIRDLPYTVGVTAQTVYVSFLGRFAPFNQEAALFLYSNNTAVYFVGKRAGVSTWMCARPGAGDGFISPVPFTNLSLLVLRLDYTGSNVMIRFYVNPPLSGEPAAGGQGPLTTATFRWNRVGVRAGHASFIDFIDEVRVGTTWADVTPNELAPPLLFAGDAAQDEGNTGTTHLVFNVRLSRTNDLPITVNFSTTNGTALAGGDYTGTNGTLTFNPGETNKTVAVSVQGDTDVEFDETIFLQLSDATNGVIRMGRGTGTIVDDDYIPPPLLAYEPFAYAEGVNLSGLNGGAGWSNAWSAGFGSAASIDSPGLTYFDGGAELLSSSNTCRISDSFIFHERAVQDVHRVNRGRLYVSFVGEVLSGNLVSLALVSGNRGLSIGANFTPNWSIMDTGAIVRANSTVSITTRSLIVARLDYDATNTVLRFYVNPSLNDEPLTPLAQTNLGLFRFNLIRLSTGFNDVDAAFDEVRVASTWSAAVPLGAISPPQIGITDAAAYEGNASPSNLLFHVKLSRACPDPVVVSFTTTNVSALAGSDYVATNGVLTFNPGETNKPLVVTVIGDAIAETNETLQVFLTNAVNGTIQDGLGIGTILDEDTIPRLAIGPGRVFEGNSGATTAVFRVRLSQVFSDMVSIDYATANGSATAGVDYAATNGTVTFAPGELRKFISVPVFGDTMPELNETFTVRLSNPLNCTLVYTNGPALIGNDDTAIPAFTDLALLTNGMAVPGESNRVFQHFIGAPAINAFNEIAFVASTVPTNGGAVETNLWIWLGPTNDLQKVMGQDMPAPGSPAGTVFSGEFAFPNLDDEGNLSFLGTLRNTTPDRRKELALYGAGAWLLTVLEEREAENHHRLIRMMEFQSLIPSHEQLGPVSELGGRDGSACAAPKHHSRENIQLHAKFQGDDREFVSLRFDGDFDLYRVDIAPDSPSPLDPNATVEFAKVTDVHENGDQRVVIGTGPSGEDTTLAVRKQDGTWNQVVETDDLLSFNPPTTFVGTETTPGYVSGAPGWSFFFAFQFSPGVSPTGLYAVHHDTEQIISVTDVPPGSFIEPQINANERNEVVFTQQIGPQQTMVLSHVDPVTGEVVSREIIQTGQQVQTDAGLQPVNDIFSASAEVLEQGLARVRVQLANNHTGWIIDQPGAGGLRFAFGSDSTTLVDTVLPASAGDGAQRGSSELVSVFTFNTGAASSLNVVAHAGRGASGNQPPTIADLPAVTATAGEKLVVPLTASDPDPNQTLTFALSNAPPGMVIETNNGMVVISWTPTLEQTNQYLVEVFVFDNGTPPQSDSTFLFVDVPYAADLSIAKRADSLAVEPNEFFRFIIDVTNHSPFAVSGVEVTDVLPPGLAGTPAANASQGSCTVNGLAVDCDLGTLPPHGTASVEVLCAAAFSLSGDDPQFRLEEYVNSASVSSVTPPDPNAINNFASTRVLVAPARCDLAMNVTVSRDYLSTNVGDSVELAVTLTNNGPNVAYAPKIEIRLSEGFAIVSPSSSPPLFDCGFDGCTVRTLDVGQGIVVRARIVATNRTPAAVQRVLLQTPNNVLVDPNTASRSFVLHSDIELPKLDVARTDAGFVISWNMGTLQAAPALGTDFTNVTFISRYTNRFDVNQMFYRVRSSPGPITWPRLQVFRLGAILDGVLQTNQNAGQVSILFANGSAPQYVNVNLDGQHVLQDMPLIPLGDPEEPQEINFNVPLPPGANGTVPFGWSITPTPTDMMPAVDDPAAPVRVKSFWAASGLQGQVLSNIHVAALNGGAVLDYASVKPRFYNREQEFNTCGPAAVANSLDYLNSLFGLGMDIDSIRIPALKEALHWDPTGIPPFDWVEDKEQYIQDKGYPIATTFTYDPDVALEAIRQCCAVEVEFTGHLASLIAIVNLGGGRYSMNLADDGAQQSTGGTRTYSVLLDEASEAVIGSYWTRRFHQFVIQCPTN